MVADSRVRHGSPSVVSGSAPVQQAGMRPGERAVAEKMKDLLEQLYEQNQGLVEQNAAMKSRIEKLEEVTMRSASSGGHREPMEQLRELVEGPSPGLNEGSSLWLRGVAGASGLGSQNLNLARAEGDLEESLRLGRYVRGKERGQSTSMRRRGLRFRERPCGLDKLRLLDSGRPQHPLEARRLPTTSNGAMVPLGVR